MAADLFGRIAAAHGICSDIIVAVELLPTRAPHHVRFRLTFTDGSRLHVSEDWQSGTLGAYSYYWLDSADNLIVGWDNAPHHTGLSTYPHHKHVAVQTRREPSDERTLEDVLAVIRQRLVR